MSHQPHHVVDPPCSRCGHSGADILIKSCQNGCAYHARCIDLMSIARQTPSSAPSSGAASNQGGEMAHITVCPCCSSPATGLEMVPLSFVEIDHARRLGGYSRSSNADISSQTPKLTSQPGKRMHVDMDSAPEASFYDPAHPRTGKWSGEEIAFRDTLVPHFVEGNLPLQNGLKLIDFLSNMLKSKPSRLTKKMKHAKLSTRHFHLDGGYIKDLPRAKELGNLEVEFVNSISDAVERSEIKFHMQKEWRDHLAERLTLLRISFDAESWLKSVDTMDRRITLAKSRNRAVKRRFMMGKAIEKDTSSPTPGIYINQTMEDEGDVDFDLLASALEKDDAQDDDLRALYTSLAGEGVASAHTSAGMGTGGAANEVSIDGSARSSLASIARGTPSPNAAEPGQLTASFRSALLPGLGSSDGTNFRFAAPFLAKITSYIERNHIPFEHVDIWVPSSSNPELDPTGATAPEPSLLGSGSTSTEGAGRLCFAGSASVGVQILPDNTPSELKSDLNPGLTQAQAPFIGYRSRSDSIDHLKKMTHQLQTSVPMSSDEMYHLSLFGSYSSKFSFTSGCGLPGRVFQSNVPAWEQFVANAPSKLFERRGGAIQFGIKTALGLPVKSPNVGRIVVVLYSRHDRVKNDGLVSQMSRDFGTLGPCPRWKLMVDMGSSGPDGAGAGLLEEPAQLGGNMSHSSTPESAPLSGLSEKNVKISNVIALLGENMPSDPTTALGKQLRNIMTLRMVLLKTNRTPEEEHLVESTLTLFESYIRAGRSRPDITLMLARDFEFHSQMAMQQQVQQAQQQMSNQAHLPPRRESLPHMQDLSLGATTQAHRGSSCQLEHLNHGGQPQRSTSNASLMAPQNGNMEHMTLAQQLAPPDFDRRSVSLGSTPDGYAVGYSAGANRGGQPSSLTHLMGAERPSLPMSEPPASLHS